MSKKNNREITTNIKFKNESVCYMSNFMSKAKVTLEGMLLALNRFI